MYLRTLMIMYNRCFYFLAKFRKLNNITTLLCFELQCQKFLWSKLFAVFFKYFHIQELECLQKWVYTMLVLIASYQCFLHVQSYIETGSWANESFKKPCAVGSKFSKSGRLPSYHKENEVRVLSEWQLEHSVCRAIP